MLTKLYGLVLAIIVSLFLFTFVPSHAFAQFSGDLGAVSGSVKWGTDVMNGEHKVSVQNTQTGFTVTATVVSNGTFNTDFSLPPGTYTVTPTLRSTNSQTGAFNLSPQTVTVNDGQTTVVNFDAQSETGLVKGSILINGQPDGGEIQICTPGGSCSFQPSDGPLFGVGSNFSIALLPGNYILHARTNSKVDLGTLPITITAGKIIDLTTSTKSLPTGQNITVSLGNVTLTFSTVTTAGFITVTSTTNPQGGLPPTAFRFLGTYYEITTTASYTGPITISIAYDPADVKGKEANLKLFHWDGTTWQDVTTSVDTVNHIITGTSQTLSPFAIGDSLNQPPSINPISNTALSEGSTYSANGSFTDTDSSSWTATVDYGDGSGVQPLTLSGTNFSLSHLYKDNGTYTVTVSITDNQGAVGTGTAAITVNNVVPSVGTITVSVNPIQVNTSTTASANFTDAGVLDTHTASWNWGDGVTTSGTVTESNGSGTVTGSHTYTTSGVYTVTLTVADNNSGVGTRTFEFISVYDPTPQGLFTAGSNFMSPAGSGLSGLVRFGLSYKYLGGVAVGNRQFTMKGTNFEFNATSVTSLVTSNGKGTLTGTGTVNGSGIYDFLVTGLDTGDTIRIRIKQGSTVIYDTQPGAPDTADPTTTVMGQVIVS